MPKIVLHIASDFPGPFSPSHVTVAIRDSIRSLEPVFENYVVVPRRTRKPARARVVIEGKEAHVSVFDPLPSYFGGATRLDWLRIARELLAEKTPALVHSHKLSYEAAIGDALARYWNVPHLISIRGSSDTHWRNHLPFSRSRFRGLLERSAGNLWLSMWARREISARTGYVVNQKDVPFPTGVPEAAFAGVERLALPAFKRLVCVARLDDYEQKGILDLIAGFKLVAQNDQDVGLDIIGPAKPETRDRLQHVIESAGLVGQVRLMGAMPRSAVLKVIAEYSAFVLLSTNETFGLVFVEALLTGVPVIYLRGSGIDGYEFASRYGIRCESRKIEDVANAIREMNLKCSHLRAELQLAIASGLDKSLGEDGMRERYRSIVECATRT